MAPIPAEQTALVKSDPLCFAFVVGNTAHKLFWYLLEQFVGRLGWLDTALPKLYHVFARVELLVALLATIAGLSLRRVNWSGFVVAAALIGCFAATCLSLYIVWTKPGDTAVLTVQGRYLIPLALFLPAAVPFALGPVSPRIARAGFWALMLFLPLSIAATLVAIAQRYWGLPYYDWL